MGSIQHFTGGFFTERWNNSQIFTGQWLGNCITQDGISTQECSQMVLFSFLTMWTRDDNSYMTLAGASLFDHLLNSLVRSRLFRRLIKTVQSLGVRPLTTFKQIISYHIIHQTNNKFYSIYVSHFIWCW